MSKRLFTSRVLAGGVRRHTLANAVDVPDEEYARRLKKYFGVPRKESLRLLDCSQIRTITTLVFEAIVEIHQKLAKSGQRLVISAGDNARRYHQYRDAFPAKGVDVCLSEEAAIRELRTGASR